MKRPQATQAPVDWSEVHRRLADSRAAIEQTSNPSGEAKKRILKARASALAREPVRKSQEESLEVMEFLLAHERYGLEAGRLREVHVLRELTPLPSLPPFVLGIFNARGRILPVIDIKKFFDLPEKGLPELNKVMVLDDGERELGILADQVVGLRRVPLREIQPSLPTLTGIREEYLRGVTPDRLVILDAEKILAGTSFPASNQANR